MSTLSSARRRSSTDPRCPGPAGGNIGCVPSVGISQAFAEEFQNEGAGRTSWRSPHVPDGALGTSLTHKVSEA